MKKWVSGLLSLMMVLSIFASPGASSTAALGSFAITTDSLGYVDRYDELTLRHGVSASGLTAPEHLQSATLTLENIPNSENLSKVDWTAIGGTDCVDIVPSEDGLSAEVTAAAVGNATIKATCTYSDNSTEIETIKVRVKLPEASLGAQEVLNQWLSVRNTSDLLGASTIDTLFPQSGPEVIYSDILSFGGTNFTEYDWNKDGINELISTNLTIYSAEGDVLQKSPHKADFVGFYDLDGDGVEECVAQQSRNKLLILSNDLQSILWKHDFTEKAASATFHGQVPLVIDNFDDTPGLEILAYLYNDYTLHVFTFNEVAVSHDFNDVDYLWKWNDPRDYYAYGIGGCPPTFMLDTIKVRKRNPADPSQYSSECSNPEHHKDGLGNLCTDTSDASVWEDKKVISSSNYSNFDWRDAATGKLIDVGVVDPTAPPPPPDPITTNWALEDSVTVSASSEEADAAKVIDGDDTSVGWAPTAGGPDEYVEIDLGEVRTVGFITIYGMDSIRSNEVGSGKPALTLTAYNAGGEAVFSFQNDNPYDGKGWPNNAMGVALPSQMEIRKIRVAGLYNYNAGAYVGKGMGSIREIGVYTDEPEYGNTAPLGDCAGTGGTAVDMGPDANANGYFQNLFDGNDGSYAGPNAAYFNTKAECRIPLNLRETRGIDRIRIANVEVEDFDLRIFDVNAGDWFTIFERRDGKLNSYEYDLVSGTYKLKTSEDSTGTIAELIYDYSGYSDAHDGYKAAISQAEFHFYSAGRVGDVQFMGDFSVEAPVQNQRSIHFYVKSPSTEDQAQDYENKAGWQDNGRVYGAFYTADVNNDGIKDGIMIADLVNRHITVGINGMQNSSRSWSLPYGYVVQDSSFLKTGFNGFADLDGDGDTAYLPGGDNSKYEIIYSVWDKWNMFENTTPTKWRTYVVNANQPEENIDADGHLDPDAVSAVLEGYVFLGAIDMDGDGVLELLMEEAGELSTYDEKNNKSIFNFVDGELVKICDLGRGSFIKEAYTQQNYDGVTVADASKNGMTKPMSLDIDADGQLEFFFQSESTGKIQAVDRTGREVFTLEEGSPAKILNLYNDGNYQLLVNDSQGSTCIDLATGEAKFSIAVAVGQSVIPVAKDMDGDGLIELITAASNGYTNAGVVTLYKMVNGEAHEVWSKPGAGIWCAGGTWPMYSGASIDRFTEDGEDLIFVSNKNAEGYLELLGYNVSGEVVFQKTFSSVLQKEGTTIDMKNMIIENWVMGDVDGDGYKDILVNYTETISAASSRSLLVSGKTGEVVWARGYMDQIVMSNQRTFGAWMGLSSMVDVDGDGKMEVYTALTDAMTLLKWDAQADFVNGQKGDFIPYYKVRDNKSYYSTPFVADWDNDGSYEVMWSSGHAHIDFFDHQAYDEYYGYGRNWQDAGNDKMQQNPDGYDFSDWTPLTEDSAKSPGVISSANGAFNYYDRIFQVTTMEFENNTRMPAIGYMGDTDGKLTFVWNNYGAQKVVAMDPNTPADPTSSTKGAKVLWEIPMSNDHVATNMLAIDFTGDGKKDVVMTTYDGWIYGIDGDIQKTYENPDDRILWSRKLADTLCAPIAVDVNDDELAEIITFGQGQIFVLGVPNEDYDGPVYPPEEESSVPSSEPESEVPSSSENSSNDGSTSSTPSDGTGPSTGLPFTVFPLLVLCATAGMLGVMLLLKSKKIKSR